MNWIKRFLRDRKIHIAKLPDRQYVLRQKHLGRWRFVLLRALEYRGRLAWQDYIDSDVRIEGDIMEAKRLLSLTNIPETALGEYVEG